MSVGTVDSSQGAEADTVILSCARANCRAAIGFVDDWRRLNVAITRAKTALIILCHARTLASSEVGEPATCLLTYLLTCLLAYLLAYLLACLLAYLLT